VKPPPGRRGEKRGETKYIKNKEVHPGSTAVPSKRGINRKRIEIKDY